MFQAWRLKVREAEEAFKSGRLEEASRLLCQGDLREFLPAKKLLSQVAAEVAARGAAHAARGETSAGWRDLEAARSLGADQQAVGSLREELTSQAMSEAQRYLEADNLDACLESLSTLERRGGSGRELRQLKQLARKADQARRLMRQGKFAQADELLAAAEVLRPEWQALSQRRAVCRQRLEESRSLVERLHQALGNEAWNEALAVAERMLELAPEYAVALEARRRAWKAVGTPLAESVPGRVGHNHRPVRLAAVHAMESPGLLCEEQAASGRRYLLWIDGVGGYLVCCGDQVVIGQPGPDGTVDVPILGDLSRQHARITRHGEGYLLHPLRPTRVNGRPAAGATSLADGSLIELGEGVRLRFRRPNPLSSTARLEFVSHHRTQPSADAVLLMADSCILAAGEQSHVVCRDLSRQVVLFRQGEDFYCRTPGPLEIDGVRKDGQGRLAAGSRAAGEDFSLSLEPI